MKIKVNKIKLPKKLTLPVEVEVDKLEVAKKILAGVGYFDSKGKWNE